MDCVFGPALPYLSQELLLVLFHWPEKRLIFRLFVPGSPEDHFREDRRKIDSFLCEQVKHPLAIRRASFRGDDSIGLPLPQAIRQYVCGDSFKGLQEFLVGPESPQHHVADNQQRPAIAQRLHRSVQRTPRPPLWTRLLLWHISTVAYFHLHFASILVQTYFRYRSTFKAKDKRRGNPKKWLHESY